ncbi:MAG: RsiV family protein [Clostridia bacterium]
MKNIYLFIITLLVFVIIILFATNVNISKNIDRYKNVEFLKYITVNSNNDKNIEKKLEEINEEKKYKIMMYYPHTKYDNLNNLIDTKINEYISEFKKDISNMNNLQSQQYYTLSSKFDTYKYNEYITYVFSFFVDTGGAHPNTYIWTITYDTNNNKVILIDDLINSNKDILNILSKLSYDILSKDKNLKQLNDFAMLKDGTLPIKNNFNKFAFTKDGLKIFFDNYQVAPYYLGSFYVVIPYKDINIFLIK